MGGGADERVILAGTLFATSMPLKPLPSVCQGAEKTVWLRWLSNPSCRAVSMRISLRYWLWLWLWQQRSHQPLFSLCVTDWYDWPV